MNAPSAGRRFSCRSGRSIWTPVGCGTCGNARPADTSSRRSSASLNHDFRNLLFSSRPETPRPAALRLTMSLRLTLSRPTAPTHRSGRRRAQGRAFDLMKSGPRLKPTRALAFATRKLWHSQREISGPRSRSPLCKGPQEPNIELDPASAPDQTTNVPRGSLATALGRASAARSSASVLARGTAGICSTVAY